MQPRPFEQCQVSAAGGSLSLRLRAAVGGGREGGDTSNQ